MLRYMDVPELIADSVDSYVDIAVRLGADTAWRREVSEKILERKKRLYEDWDAVKEWTAFLLRVPYGNLDESSVFIEPKYRL